MEKIKANRWRLVRDSLIFQVKLGLDALRDLLLSPVSIGCTLYDLIKGHDQHNSSFYKLMALGQKSDHWLNLFGCGDQPRDAQKKVWLQGAKANDNQGERNVDQLFAQVEALLKEQHNQGGLTASAKTSIDRYLDKIVSKKTAVQDAEQADSDPRNK